MPDPASPADPATADPDGPADPQGASVSLPAAIRDAIVSAARAAAPLEMCGLIVGSGIASEGGRPLRWVETRNAAASPYLFEVDAADLVRVSLEVDAREEALWAIVHSHVASPARPSPTDIRGSFYPDVLHLIVSLAEAEADPATGRPSLRAWRISGDAATEVALGIEP
jgi:proteasome lid subunit RPN8/RPN11